MQSGVHMPSQTEENAEYTRPIHLDAIPLKRAMICVNCEMVVIGRNDCPVCGSRSVMSLARILNRKDGLLQR